MKKIKSVKLKNDFRTYSYFVPKGTEFIPYFTGKYSSIIADKDIGVFTVREIEYNTTDLFEIEYENEPKIITVKIEYEDKGRPESILTVEKVSNILNDFYAYNNVKVTEVKNGWHNYNHRYNINIYNYIIWITCITNRQKKNGAFNKVDGEAGRNKYRDNCNHWRIK